MAVVSFEEKRSWISAVWMSRTNSFAVPLFCFVFGSLEDGASLVHIFVLLGVVVD